MAGVNRHSAAVHSLPTSSTGDAVQATSSGATDAQVPNGSAGISKVWAWISGSDSVAGNCNAYNNCGQPGLYGTLGVPSAANVPGGRSGPSTWTDSSGNLWLFGGSGFDANGNLGELNDLWKFNPATSQWTWMGGSSWFSNSCAQVNYCGASGVYGTLHTPAPGNVPGGRSDGVSWTDRSGHLWLFGGYGIDAGGNLGYLNDLWEFNPSTNEWAWMGGSSTLAGEGSVYGSLGTPAAGNVPGGRSSAVSWVDGIGRLWLFSGLGHDASGALGYLNDVWEFDPSTQLWAWMGGSSTIGNVCGAVTNCGRPGVYGTPGTPAAGNIPGGRQGADAWTDGSGNAWLFGGFGFDGQGGWSALNDLWRFDPSTNQWTWVGGSSTIASSGAGQPTVYGTLGAPAAGNDPGGHYQCAHWMDGNEHLWIFGGVYSPAANSSTTAGDLWEFNPATGEWTWWGGYSAQYNPAVYGTLGVGAAGNFPGHRNDAVAWSNGSGNPWLFGGGGFDINDKPGFLNDLWTYEPAPVAPAAATPSFHPPAGTYASAQSVTISDATPGATIYYTTDGTTPTTGSGVYSAPLTVASSKTIKAIATSSGYAESAVATATYTITLPAAAPTFNPPAGTYTSAQSVTISDATPDATIYYTTDGTTPTTGSSVYRAPIVVASSETIQAIATATGYSASPVARAAYTIALPAAAPTFNPPAGAYANVQNVTISDGTAGAVIYFTMDGSTPTTSSSVYRSPIVVAKSETLKAIATAAGHSASPVGSAAYAITLPTTTKLTASPNPAPFGTTVTFTATVANASETPVGSVSFYDGSVPLATKSLTSGAATYLTGSLGVGSHKITAAYAAGAGFSGSKSNAVVEVISPADFTISASPGARTIYEGEATSYSITITPGVGFSLPVELACTKLPANTICKFSPSTVSGGSGSATLSVQTDAPRQTLAASAVAAKAGIPVLATFFLIFTPRRFRRLGTKWTLFPGLLLSVFLGIAITGCGGPSPITGGTPVGAQTVTVTGVATSGSQSLRHAVTVRLHVKPLF
jgi:N-acetylneuraminic acid mutarotase